MPDDEPTILAVAAVLIGSLLFLSDGESVRSGISPRPGRGIQNGIAVDVPPRWRIKNWRGPRGTGSCSHATTAQLLKWQGQHELAQRWMRSYSDGEHASRHTERMRKFGLRYARTTDGDERLLQWAIANRLGAGVHWPRGHMQTLVGKKGNQAVLLDNNNVSKYRTYPWAQFVQQWKRNGGWAFTVVYKVPPPSPVKRLAFQPRTSRPRSHAGVRGSFN